MSVTTTSNPVSGSVLQVLTDYDLHHSGQPETPGVPQPPNPRSPEETQHNNPDNWPQNHRRVPDYRPINRNLDMADRPNGVNLAEQAFIFSMLQGCSLNAGAAGLWRATGGKLNDRIFYYKIGGEK